MASSTNSLQLWASEISAVVCVTSGGTLLGFLAYVAPGPSSQTDNR